MVIGHRKQQEFLNKILKNDSRSLLFTGPESLGKKTVALSFFNSLFDENPLNHPDFILINQLDGVITIDQIRELSKRISLKPIKSSFFGVIIDQAHLMNRSAQNSFLKTLEEPKSNTILILITEYPDFLLKTILSRCERLKFYPVKKEEIRTYLKQNNVLENKINKIEEISLGRPGIAIDCLKNSNILNERQMIINDLLKIMEAPLGERFQFVKTLYKKENLRNILIVWLSYLRRLLVLDNNVERLSKLTKILNMIQGAIFLISNTSTNTKLVLEVLVMEF